MSTDVIVVATGIVLWFAQGWYLNDRLERVHAKLDLVLESFDGLRDYLYEIDPQFDDERAALHDLYHAETDVGGMFGGMEHHEITKRKKAENRRTLNSPLGGV